MCCILFSILNDSCYVTNKRLDSYFIFCVVAKGLDIFNDSFYITKMTETVFSVFLCLKMLWYFKWYLLRYKMFWCVFTLFRWRKMLWFAFEKNSLVPNSRHHFFHFLYSLETQWCESSLKSALGVWN